MTDHDTPGQRVYLVRLACGDGKRTPMPQAAFAALVKKKTRGVALDGAKVSRLETGGQEVDVPDARAIAAVDPLHRGPAWIIFGIQEPSRAPTAAEALANAEDGYTVTPKSQRKKSG